MTTQNEFGQENQFVRAVLPWLVAAAALVLYLATLNHWISLGSIPYVARAAGQVWTPELTGPYGAPWALGPMFGPYPPLFYLVTYPFRLLPAVWIPLALNVFTALCASLSLALLARSVALLPHDRTHEQRLREQSPFALLSIRNAWIPPVLAVAVCGLQSAFWESATSVSSDMFELLLFAYALRCLLEFRIDESDRWLYKATAVYAAGITGDWVLIALLPVFITAVVWLKGLSVFHLRFLRRLALCALGGLLLYFLLPVLYHFSSHPVISFWQAIRVNLTGQKDLLQIVFMRLPKTMLLLMATTSLLPIFLISIRWASYFGDPSRIGIAVTTGVLHLAQAAVLALCLWVAFDPAFSPYAKGLGLPELRLPLFYLGALSVGYFAGYFLLVFTPMPRRMGRGQDWELILSRCVKTAIWILLIVVPAGLIAKNIRQIRMTNGPELKRYARLLNQGLPESAVVLSDDGARLFLAKSWAARYGHSTNQIFLDTQSLSVPTYYLLQHDAHPDDFPAAPELAKAKKVPDLSLVKVMRQFADKKRPIYYLHPSFGYYFEFFYPEPRGLILELNQFPTNMALPPPLTSEVIASNDEFWKRIRADFAILTPSLPGATDSTPVEDWIRGVFHLPKRPNATATTLGRYYSQSLNSWGVGLQRAGKLKDAAAQFESALSLNPDNSVAKFNLACNKELLAGSTLQIRGGANMQEEFSQYRSWPLALRENGPFDDPTHCLGEAVAFAQGHLIREAAEEFDRVRQLVPGNLAVQVWLAQFYATHSPQKSLDLVASVRAHPEAWETNGIRAPDLGVLEATALFADHKPDQAQALLRKTIGEYPQDERLLGMAVQISATFGQISNALDTVDRELQLSPTNLAALVAKGYLSLQSGKYEDAIPPLTKVLELETNNYTVQYAALLDRAIAYLQANKLEEAREDYEALLRQNPGSYRLYYGLGEIAWRKKDTNAAVHYYELYLTNSVYGSDEAKIVGERLASLKGQSP